LTLAKATGIGWTTLSVDDNSNSQQAIKNDFTNVSFSTPRAVQDVTGVDKTAIERLLLLADMSWTGNGVFNAASNMSHAVFSTIPLSSAVTRLVTMVVNGKTLAPTLALTDYQLTRPATGELTWQVPGSLSSGTAPTWS
jgi:hypothetical protein